jgi:ornithine decarboxylase
MTTPAIEAFLQGARPPTPFLVTDLDVVANRYRRLVEALPGVEICYAVKANPAPPVLSVLAGLGASFDVASPGEVAEIAGLGVGGGRMSYGSTVKKRTDITSAVQRGVNRYSVDCAAELDKVIDLVPDPTVCVRIAHDGAGAEWPLGAKFGCSPGEAVDLLVAAGRAGAIAGIGFHVGSQQHRPEAWRQALFTCADVFSQARSRGGAPSFVNLGGGFPAMYLDEIPPIEEFGSVIGRTAASCFDDEVQLMAEPGRYLVAEAGLIRSEVVLVSTRNNDTRRWVYLDVGIFSGLVEPAFGEAIRYRLRTSRDGPAEEVVIAGPTCDSADVIYEKSAYRLPVALQAGDQLDLLAAGAYTHSYSTVGFNGFPPLTQHFVGRVAA